MRDLFFLTCGMLRSPAFAMGPTMRVSPLKTLDLSVTVGVVVRDDGQVVLVDAGWSEEACAAPVRVLGRARAKYTGIRARPGDGLAAQLAGLGIERARVAAIVATHLHIDHIGGAVDFPNAEVICTDRELAAFRKGPHFGYRQEDLGKSGRIRTIALTTDPTYGFPASFDLFGDGSVVLLDARGHTRGGVAVALRGARGCFVHIGDAAYHAFEYGLGGAPTFAAKLAAWDRRELARTYACIRACEADPRRPVIVPSHDRDVFARLPRAPLVN